MKNIVCHTADNNKKSDKKLESNYPNFEMFESDGGFAGTKCSFSASEFVEIWMEVSESICSKRNGRKVRKKPWRPGHAFCKIVCFGIESAVKIHG